jgi:hypothetical protein
MVDGLHTYIGNRIMKLLIIALSGIGKGCREGCKDRGGDLTNVQ